MSSYKLTLIRRRMQTVGCMGIISGRVRDREADWAKSVFASPMKTMLIPA